MNANKGQMIASRNYSSNAVTDFKNNETIIKEG